MTTTRITLAAALIFAATIGRAASQVDPGAYVNFEGAQTNPIRLSADGTRLFVVNTPDARLSVFDLADPSAPALIAEIPVGIEPVSVHPRTNDEAWVVNQVSDSVSIVSVSQGVVIHTLVAKDEPADVVFANDLAFVSISRSNTVRVFDAVTRALVREIPLLGENPRALAVNPAGTKVYVAFALSGNGTTVVPLLQSPPPEPPTNPALPPPPDAALIVAADDPAWSSAIRFDLPDFDVAEIDVATQTVTDYIPRVGTVNLGIAVRPFAGDVYVSNTEALNLVKFEPNLRGHFIDNRVTRITRQGAVTPVDLNPGLDYSTLPNPAAQAVALSQPAGIVFEPLGRFMYVAAFGSDRVAVVDPDGRVLSRIEVGPATGAGADSRNMRGPRGLALHAAAQRLYVANRISNTISVIDTTRNAVVGEIPVGAFDPTPDVIRAGRGFLYDARLSGNGTASCAACHIDADLDMLAWELGDPGGDMQTVVSGGNTFELHPMKGPKTTQTLRGLKGLEPLHWRGDRENFAAFNGAFDKLMGGAPLSDADMTAYADFIDTIAFQPNPNQDLDRTLPSSFAGADPVAGRITFLRQPFATSTETTCNSCHKADPGPGTNREVVDRNDVQAMKVPHLRNVYQKMKFVNSAGARSTIGFGFSSHGEDTLPQVLGRPAFGIIAIDPVRKANVMAFLQCFDTGAAPAVGYTRTITAGTVSDAISDWTLLEAQARVRNIDLIVKGTIDGQVHGLLYRPVNDEYVSDTSAIAPMPRLQLLGKIAQGDVLSVMGVPPGSGIRMGIDRDLDGVRDGDDP